MSNEKRQKELQEKIDLIINQMNRLEEEKIEWRRNWWWICNVDSIQIIKFNNNTGYPILGTLF